MAQNVIIKGDWSNVPEVLLNKEGGGKARFVDTSPTTATDADVASGKIYFKANGDQSTGMASGGGTVTLQAKTKSYTPTETAQSEATTYDSGYDGLSQVTVNVGAISSTYVGSGITRRSTSDLQVFDDVVVVPAGYYSQEAEKSVGYVTHPNPTVSIDANGLITASHTSLAGYADANTKTATLQLTKRTSSSLTASGATVTAPAGYYPSDATKAISSGSARTPATTITANPTISIDSDGLITASVSGSKNITPTVTAGYVSSGTSGTVTVTGSATNQMTKRTSSDLTVSGLMVTAPAGYYPQAASKQVTVSTGSATTPTTTITATPTISVDPTTGEISVSISGSQSITPTIVEGYVSAGTAGTVSASGSGTQSQVNLTANDITCTITDSAGIMGERSNKVTMLGGGFVPGSGITKSNAFPNVSSATINSASIGSGGALTVNWSPDTAGMVYTNGMYSMTKANAFTTQAGSTITPSAAQQLAVAANTFVTGNIYVAAATAGLVTETGTYTPSNNTAKPTISFANSHTNPPAIIVMTDTSSASGITSNSNTAFMLIDFERLNGAGYPYSTSATRYALAAYIYRTSNGSTLGSTQIQYGSDNTGSSSTGYYRYWATASAFYPYSNSSSRYWRSGRTYKWIAIWK